MERLSVAMIYFNINRVSKEYWMEAAATRCTECGAMKKPAEVLCSRCHRPRWHTLKRVSACLLVVAVFAVLIRYVVMHGDRKLNIGLDDRTYAQQFAEA